MTPTSPIEWAKLLEMAVKEPGLVSDAYRRFYGQYSLGNRIFALWQCAERGLEPGPLASFGKWKELGRSVKKGEKAIALCMPLTRCRTQTDENGQETELTYQFFTIKHNWFVLSQTQGPEYTPEPLPEWNEAHAVTALQIEKIPFHLLNGNVQGYAAPGRKVSINPVAERPLKTLFHEVAHLCSPGNYVLCALQLPYLYRFFTVDRHISVRSRELLEQSTSKSFLLPAQLV